ncbi:MAG: hypothetical protein GX992_03045 [Clostridium sp.]|nr:hypothetical protein [Clostridium sp.]
MRPHIHKYKFDTKITTGHKHILFGYTEYTVGLSIFHIHAYHGISSFCGHTHYFSGFTGFPIKTENGHVHKMENILCFASGHQHTYSNYTFEDTEYISSLLRYYAYNV